MHAFDIVSLARMRLRIRPGQACTPSESRLHKDTASASSASRSVSRASPIQVQIPSVVALRAGVHVQSPCHQKSASLKPALARLSCYFRRVQGSTRSPPSKPRPASAPVLRLSRPPAPPCSSPPRGPTRSSAPDSRDLTLHLYLHLTCRAARQANPRFPTLPASLRAHFASSDRRSSSHTTAHMALCRNPSSEDFCADQRSRS